MDADNILNKLNVGVLVISPKGELILVNSHLITEGLALEDWEGKRYYEAISSMNLISVIHDLIEKESISVEYEEKGKWYRVVGTKEEEEYIVQVSDITELKRCEISQKEFLANVSHELKTPLAVVKTTLETLWEEEDSRRKRFIERALSRLRELVEIIDSIYYLTFLELSKARKFAEIELYELIEEIISQKLGEIREKELKVGVNIPEGIKVLGDYEKIKIMLGNLIDNSIKYNIKGGEVLISVKEEEEGVLISVKDTGIGIEPEKIPFIFQPFFKGAGNEGLGLGLSIADRIAKFHGTRIEVESSEGSGTTFRVRLEKA